MPVQLADEWKAFEAAIGHRPQMSGANVLEIRHASRQMIKASKAAAAQNTYPLNVYDTTIEGPHSIKVRVYEPTESGDAGSHDVGLFFHGGGWCIGDVDLEDDLVKFMAWKTNMKFISVDYRLGPEDPWPAQLEDCVAAVQWARSSQPEKHDNTRLYLVGTSAGAHLALSTALKLSKTTSTVDGVVALAPFAIRREDAKSHDGSEPGSHQENFDAPLLQMETLHMFLDAVKAPVGDPSFSILLSPSFQAMPPIYIVTCGADILRDHGPMLAERLKNDGVPVKIDNYPGYPHTFWTVPGIKMGVTFRSNLLLGLEFIRKPSA
ncbi:hypothetical protein NLU13_3574 [Sarocladium strictum]|uniref:Alpha/beta hydrolase fold-3 domain-containing protein n=1 Tax=Sarocladium strictum TaxID=5046 RepID=A0AA39L9W8_SARSR|nr:hypothetical protein NLU13_3574 [Sarocladium strictum]